jgi:two-component system, cell cycle sensor histidine kinase and response regulator CckA
MKEHLRILLLEDLPTDAELIVDELELNGLEFSHKIVDNEKDFLHQLENFNPDIVLSDYSLPTFNGMAALALVKERFPHIPVIMVTASINEETAVSCMLAGALDYILKDKMKRLGMAVRSVLENQELKLHKIKAERALKENGRYYRALLNQMNEHVLVIDKNYKITDVNQTFLQHRGYNREEVIGQRCYKLHCNLEQPCDKAGEACILPKVFKTGKPERLVRQQQNKSGLVVWYSISMSPMLDKNGNVVAVIESSTDVTELMRAQEEIQKLLTAIEQSPVSVVLTDADGTIEYINPHFTKISGYTRDEILGGKPSLLKSNEQNDNFYKELWNTISGGGVWHGEFHNKRKDGTLFWEDATIGPILNDRGVTTHYMAVKEDITEKKRLNQELGQAQKMEAIGRLAGGVAHDFNNLLTVINGYSDLALTRFGSTSEVTTNYIKQISKAGKKASRLTQQLLAFGRKQVMQPEILDLNQAIKDTGKMLKRLIGENINLQTSLQKDLPAIEADPAQLDQIIINLVVNARDAMPDGGDLAIESKTISFDQCQTTRLDPNIKNWVQFSIQDSGSGMNEETKQHIFEPFFSTKGKKGAGLGMATVYGIISQNDWHIELFSTLKIGTTFNIYIPASEKNISLESGRSADSLLEGKETILFVEDESNVRTFVAGCLDEAGYTVLQAAEGLKALALVDGKLDTIDLLLSDVVMPNMGGKELAKLLRQQKPDLKIIYISGYSDETITQSGMLEQETIFMQKPFSAHDLLKLVRKTLDEEQA